MQSCHSQSNEKYEKKFPPGISRHFPEVLSCSRSVSGALFTFFRIFLALFCRFLQKTYYWLPFRTSARLFYLKKSGFQNRQKTRLPRRFGRCEPSSLQKNNRLEVFACLCERSEAISKKNKAKHWRLPRRFGRGEPSSLQKIDAFICLQKVPSPEFREGLW